MKPIYALLVGIDNYPAPVPKLGGASKDVQRIKSYIEANFNDRPIHLKTLIDQEATRNNFLDAFKNHLGQATEKDVIWFHYSGHGSRQQSAEEFFDVNSGKKDETLVLYDSRPNGKDLADKELAILLHNLSKTKAHILVTLDCCHSGAGTRSATEYTQRLSAERPDKRTLDDYMDGYYKTNGLHIPNGKYLFFAACSRFQTSKESFDGGGLFTQNFVDTLSANGKEISYADLLVQLRQGVVKMKWDQDPHLELVGNTDSYAKFLDGTTVENFPRYALSFSDDNWTIDGGQILGITEDVNLAIYEDGAKEPLLNTKVNKSTAQRATISTLDTLQKDKKYWVRPLNAPDVPFQFTLDLDKELVGNFIDRAKPFPLLQFKTIKAETDPYLININGDFIEVTDLLKSETLFKAKKDHPNAVSELCNRLNQIATWHRIFRLQNQKANITNSSVKVWLEFNNEKYEPGDFTLQSDGSKLPYKLFVHNLFTQPLHFALFYLSDHYGITLLKNEPLEKSDSPNLLWGGGELDYFHLPDGLSSSTDILFLIVSTEATDDFQLVEKDLDFGEIPLAHRAVPGLSRSSKIKGEWFTNRFVLTLKR